MKEDTQLLLDWYDAERRILPWREDPTPYHVWLSEIMLQQTRVEAVKDYYARFLAKLPDVAALAAADEDTYLKLWEGLGYYSRVRNLHKAAVTVMEEYGGEIPSTAKELQKLSGIGEYTAAAIASIAFGEPVSSVDGNLLRVYARRTLYRENIKEPAAKKVAFDYYMERMPEDRPGDYNQALMDLGATVCLPNGKPECHRCPWADVCKAHKQGVELEVPVVPAKKARRVEHLNVYRVHCGEELLLSKRPDTGLLAGLYEFPNDLLEPDRSDSRSAEETARRQGALTSKSTSGKLSKKQVAELSKKALERFLSENALNAVSVFPLPAAKHIFSHVEWHMTGYDVEVASLEGLPSAPGVAMPEPAEGALSENVFSESASSESVPSKDAVSKDTPAKDEPSEDKTPANSVSKDTASENASPENASSLRKGLQTLFKTHISELDRYSIPNAFDAFKF